ncbi:MAG: hypothetical protein KME28_17590 [Pelatocladus maniniholoensis HA4357-MV3]|jgi:hypothetical protein|uniref:Uncharacterized protein n=1 Tax=Pelatocladus maniniholoensis HA4357-MV3 TaxID=1117104 RepID=A0A9E3HB38_9NOST|nr:hypothetical protein [Pelatocladus maniniholoensis HA4357-MV3]BAZ69000.1 hypothetical protein NIES4106_37690 [Fischerella sp. NIES-4106]
MTRIAISDISLEQSYFADLSETESALVKGGLDFNSFLLSLATLSAVVALKKIDAIQTIFVSSIQAIAGV